jgi:hypothetical protein
MFSFMMVALVVAAGKQNVWMRFWMRLFEGFVQNCELGRNIPNFQIRRPQRSYGRYTVFVFRRLFSVSFSQPVASSYLLATIANLSYLHLHLSLCACARAISSAAKCF